MPMSCAVMLAGEDDFPLNLLLFWLFLVAEKRAALPMDST